MNRHNIMHAYEINECETHITERQVHGSGYI